MYEFLHAQPTIPQGVQTLHQRCGTSSFIDVNQRIRNVLLTHRSRLALTLLFSIVHPDCTEPSATATRWTKVRNESIIPGNNKADHIRSLVRGIVAKCTLLLAQDSDEKAVLSLVLQRAGLAVTSGEDLERAMRIWSDRPADLILLALPDVSQVDVRAIRSEITVPVIVILDQADEETHFGLLEAGADIVVSRPYSAHLLIAQARALARRAGSIPLANLPEMTVSDLTLDPASCSVQVANQPARRLTHLEFRLLYTLMKPQRRSLHRDDS